MINISIANERLYPEMFESTHHNLMTDAGIDSAYQRAEEIKDKGDIYTIVEIDYEWNYFETSPLLDEVVEIAELLNKMDKEQHRLFQTIAKTRKYDPAEVAERVFLGCVISMEDLQYEHENDIWNITEMNGEKVALTY